MIIPKGVDYAQFYRNAKKAGVKIRSRFMNVNPWEGRDNLVLFWVAQSGKTKNDENYVRKSFPFTELGEEDAHNFIADWKIKFGTKTVKDRFKREDPKILQRG